MKLTAAKLLVLVALFPFLCTQAQSPDVKVEKEPSWVTLTTINYTSNTLDAEAADGSIHLAFEKQVSLPQQSTYLKKAIKVLSEAGVQNSSEIVLDFDPAYEQLIVHTVKLIRGNEIINKLPLAKFKVIQQEKELDRHLYNGSLSAILVLDDVRKGDVIEYSYSLKGFNPIFNGRYASDFETNFSVPVYQIYYKLIAPANRPLTVKNRNGNLIPTVHTIGNETVYEWQLKEVSALHLQDKVPSWYDPYSYISVSQFQSWKEVNDWAKTLFSFPQYLSPELKKKISDIRAQYPSPEEQTIAALRFVQDDIRYMGIEMGENSHKPTHPNKIFAQRFGDCKDKSYLLCTMLQVMGIEAHPVLINTTYKNTLTTWLPAATAFDHTTVQVVLNHKKYWFDPTIAYQRGPIESISYPDYQYGLVISDTTTALTAIPHQEKGMVTVKEAFDILDMVGNAKLVVTTLYSGSFADNMRDDYYNTSRFDLQNDFKNFYHSYFDHIRSDSVSFSDNEKTGTFTTKEYYTISGIWEQKKELKKIAFSPYIINSILKKPSDADRTMPISVAYPAHYKESIEITLPEDWNADDDAVTIQCASFLLRSKYTHENNKVWLEYELENYKDHVTPGEANDFYAQLDKADENMGYRISKSDEVTVTAASSSPWSNSFSNNIPTLYAILGVSLFITIMVKRQKG